MIFVYIKAGTIVYIHQNKGEMIGLCVHASPFVFVQNVC